MKIPSSLDDNLVFLVGEAQKLIYKNIDQRFRNLGLGVTVEQFSILALLYYSDGIRQQDVADSLRKDKTTITRVLRNMISSGLIKKEEDPVDARTKRIFLTKKGRSVQQKLVEESGQVYVQAMDFCRDEEVDIAIKVLRHMIINLE